MHRSTPALRVCHGGVPRSCTAVHQHSLCVMAVYLGHAPRYTSTHVCHDGVPRSCTAVHQHSRCHDGVPRSCTAVHQHSRRVMTVYLGHAPQYTNTHCVSCQCTKLMHHSTPTLTVCHDSVPRSCTAVHQHSWCVMAVYLGHAPQYTSTHCVSWRCT